MDRTTLKESQVDKNIPEITLLSVAICQISSSVTVWSHAPPQFSLIVYNDIGGSSAVRAGTKVCLGRGFLNVFPLKSLDILRCKSLNSASNPRKLGSEEFQVLALENIMQQWEAEAQSHPNR